MTYYISTRGNDASAGTSKAEAWQTFEPLRSVRLGPGDRVLLEEGGTWEGPLRLTGSGSADAPILLGSYGPDGDPVPRQGWEDGFAARPRPCIAGSAGAVVELVDVSHWIISGIEVECTSPDTMYPGLRSVDDPGGLGDAARPPEEAVNCGILVRNSSGPPREGIVVQDCFVHGRGPNQNSEGIHVSAETSARAAAPALTDVRIRNNLVDGAGQYRGVGAKWGPAGLWPWSCAHVLIEFNEVTGMFDGNVGADATGIDIDWNSHHVTVRSNHCYGNMGCGIVTMSCRDSSIESNRVEGNLCKVNLGSGQIALSDFQNAQGPHAITGLSRLAIRDNPIILDRDNTAAISTVTISGGAWEGIDFTGNRIVFFDHTRDQYAYDLHDATALRSAAGNVFYGSAEGAFRAVTGGAARDLGGWRAAGRDTDSMFRPLDGTASSPVTDLAAERTSEGVTLRWTAAADTLSGVHHYNVYRGSHSSFPTRCLTLVGQPREAAFVDIEPGWTGEIWYKVDAEDACGNCSGHPAVVRLSPA